MNQKYKTIYSLGVIASMLLLASCGQSAKEGERTLNLYNWNDYIDEQSIPEFEEKTGITVIYDQYDSNDTVEAKLTAGKSGYDIIFPSMTTVDRFIRAGLLQKLDKSMIPNLANVDPNIQKQMAVYDPGNEHAVIYMWGTTAIGYNKTKIDALLPNAPYDSWDLLLDPANAKVLQECGIGIVDSAEDFLPDVMIHLGLDPNTNEVSNLEAAKKAVMKIRPYIRYFDTARYINDLANGEICLVVAYNGDVLQARDRAAEANLTDEIAYSIPSAGSILWMDAMIIPADAENVEEAHEFINFILEPEVTARITNYVNYANGNAASLEFVDDAVKNDKGVYPDSATMEKLIATVAAPEDYIRTRTEIWTEIKTGK